MSDIISLFKGLYNTLGTLLGFVEDFFKSLIAILNNIPGTISFLSGAIASLPTFVTAFASLTLAITVAYFIVNRKTGGSD